ncbi:MAG: carbohydrate ABC transporter permease [Alphaproteobacteria bacterium]
MTRLVGRTLFSVVVALILFYALFPFAWAVLSSLKAGAELFRPDLVPAAVTFENYGAVFEEQPFLRNILNSILVAGATVAVSLVCALFAAYALSRVSFRGRRPFLYGILGVAMFPQIAVLAGMFELIRWLGLFNSWPGLALAYLLFTLPFTVWVLTVFMADVPRDMEDAALIDGVGPFTLVVRIFLPLVAPALAATGLLAFIAAWNEFLFALTFTLTSEARTVPVAIALISGATAYELPWGRVMAASVIVTVPLVALVLIFQRLIVSGLTAGALKG